MFEKSNLYKIYFYNLSLVPLYLTFFLQKVSVDTLLPCSKEHYLALLKSNSLSIVLVGLVLLSLLMIAVINWEMKFGFKTPKKYTKIKSSDFEHLTFISTYIIPLMAFKLDTTRDLVVLFFVIVFMGMIYIKANLYYLNPILLLFGYKVFKGEREDGKEYILLTQEKELDGILDLKYIDLGNNIHFVKKTQ